MGNEPEHGERLLLWQKATASYVLLRTLILNDPSSGIDGLHPYVCERIAEAADVLEECADSLASVYESMFVEQEESDGT